MQNTHEFLFAHFLVWCGNCVVGFLGGLHEHVSFPIHNTWDFCYWLLLFECIADFFLRNDSILFLPPQLWILNAVKPMNCGETMARIYLDL